MNHIKGYDKAPYIGVEASARRCDAGWREIGERLRASVPRDGVVAVECYPGARVSEIESALAAQLRPATVIRPADALLGEAEIATLVRPYLTDDPVFGIRNELRLEALFDPSRLEQLRRRARASTGMTLIVGTGAALFAEPGVLVYADLARWEIQQRQRRGEIANLGAANYGDSPGQKYKRAFFIDWRVADRLKADLLPRIQFLLDTNGAEPKMISGDDLRRGLDLAASRPFRVVPFFDPGPWGGDWMLRHFDLPAGPPNYAWCFDCVPEENSMLLGFGERRVEIPALDAVLWRPRDLLGDFVYRAFGAEFPIRFDLLDTMNGGNLSLQVHPLQSYIRERFGMAYTQDESYYLLAAAPDAAVYLGLREGIDREAMAAQLRDAQAGGPAFAAERFVNRWPARTHDHFLIPAGTVHCSGRNCVVLEISATPYIFTFKLWDWGRLGLDGLPRPIHLEHGLANIRWERDTRWVRDHLLNRVEEAARGDCWREERTGLHPLEFIETRRHWFTGPTPHRTNGSVNVLNLVQGEAAVVESPAGRFEPFVVHYAETFIVPAAAEEYTITPLGPGADGAEHATVRAAVRNGAVGDGTHR